MTALRIENVRARATVQDLGRPGFRHLGVPAAGAADRGSLRRANHLVGNGDGAAAIEVVLGGLTVRALRDVRFAVVGAPWSINGADQPSDAAQDVSAGATLAIGQCVGAYAYLAVSGGVDVEPVLGSCSTDTLSGLGPPPLQAGAELRIGSMPISAPSPKATSNEGALRVVLGPRDDWFTDEAVATLVDTDWVVTPSSDRVGLRLSGPRLARRTDDELPSEGMIAGAIQVPPDGQPILFLTNHPTTGGYPVIAVVVSADVDRAAQHRPGAQLRFRT